MEMDLFLAPLSQERWGKIVNAMNGAHAAHNVPVRAQTDVAGIRAVGAQRVVNVFNHTRHRAMAVLVAQIAGYANLAPPHESRWKAILEESKVAFPIFGLAGEINEADSKRTRAFIDSFYNNTGIFESVDTSKSKVLILTFTYIIQVYETVQLSLVPLQFTATTE